MQILGLTKHFTNHNKTWYYSKQKKIEIDPQDLAKGFKEVVDSFQNEIGIVDTYI